MSDKPSFLRSAPRLDVEQRNNHPIRRWTLLPWPRSGVDRGVKRVYDAVQERR